jgi:hypothetical protein
VPNGSNLGLVRNKKTVGLAHNPTDDYETCELGKLRGKQGVCKGADVKMVAGTRVCAYHRGLLKKIHRTAREKGTIGVPLRKPLSFIGPRIQDASLATKSENHDITRDDKGRILSRGPRQHKGGVKPVRK